MPVGGVAAVAVVVRSRELPQPIFFQCEGGTKVKKVELDLERSERGWKERRKRECV